MKNIVLAALVVAFAGTCASARADSQPPFPGSYVVTLKGELPSAGAGNPAGPIHVTRLSTYSFRADGTVREDAWKWDGNVSGGTDVDGEVVGTPMAPAPSCPAGVSLCADADKHVLISSIFQGAASLRVGSYSFNAAGSAVDISWPDGQSEHWTVDQAWDANMTRLYLAGTNYLTGNYYTDGSASTSAVNAGWGFGGFGIFLNRTATLSDMKQNLVGCLIRHNSWSATDEPVASDSMNLGSLFAQTSASNVLRYVTADATSSVFSYLAKTPDAGAATLRVNYHTGHDFNGNGYIADDFGHVYAGLQIIDRTQAFRGFVFSDASWNATGTGNDHDTISSLYYLKMPSGSVPAGTCP
jgi:hypothetical protein